MRHELASNEDACLILLDDALSELAKLDARKRAIVEMRFFLGLTAEETAETLRISTSEAARELRLAQAWLRREISRRTASHAETAHVPQASVRMRSTSRSTS